MKGSVHGAIMLVVVGVALVACRRRDEKAADPSPVEVAHGRVASLNLRIVDSESAPVTRAKQGQLLQTEVTLTNASNHPLWVNKRLTLNADEAAPYAREVSIKILGPKQTPVPYHCVTDVALPKADDYVVLNPHDHLRRIDEMDCFDLSSSGTYVLMARYKDGNEAPPAAPPGATHLFEEFESPLVKVEIVP